MARTIEFDKNSALEKATGYFWSVGYEAASMRDLASAMQVNMGSLYNTFGGKDECFAAALEHYLKIYVEPTLAALSAADDPLAALKMHLQKIVDGCTTSAGAQGCFLLNTALELSERQNALAVAAHEYLALFHKTLHVALQSAHDKGQIRANANIDEITNYLMGVMLTLRTFSRMKADQKMMADYLKTALSVL